MTSPTTNSSKLPTDICRIPVRFSEIDSMRRVWHGSFLLYFEDGRESFGRHFPGIGYDVMQREGIYAPVYDLNIRYLAPLQLNDVALVHTTYNPHPGARLDFSYKVYRESDGQLCAEGTTTQLFIDQQGMLMLQAPAFYETWKKSVEH